MATSSTKDAADSSSPPSNAQGEDSKDATAEPRQESPEAPDGSRESDASPKPKPTAERLAAQPQPPSLNFAYIFDKRLVWTFAVLALVGVMSCDWVNHQLDIALAPSGPKGPDTSLWVKGATAEVGITLITKDANRLACADDRELEGVRCGFTAEKKRRRREPDAPVDDNQSHVIQPYRTAVGNHLVMVAGLWNTPEVALRYHQESPRGIAESKLQRFAANCRLRFVGELKNVLVRWQPSQKWYTEKSSPVAIAEHCTLAAE